MIYKLIDDYKNTYSPYIDGVELGTKMPTYRPRFLGKPRLHEWVAPEASFYYCENFEGMRETLPDVSIWSLGVIVLSPGAYKVFHACLEKAGEFLPITIESETYYLFNVLYIIPELATNKEKAVEIIDSGVHLGQGNVSFDESFLEVEEIAVFKTPTDRLVFSYCTERFKKLYEVNGFKGLVFEPVEVK
ncbi:hypothetical protein [Cellvibrio sp. pealriver]|uniref:hypothetical protein n=1 Tax=Cellvibrio sp. pealriver TaxID=1622269 RepID=UPI00066FFE95|nr:hypothetical protein [Cellvibrio sp. pealriver]